MLQPIRLALLLCDTPVPKVFEQKGTYLDVFKEHLEKSLPTAAFRLDGFDVVRAQEYPDLDADTDYKGILISGSAASAYEDLPWINKLVAFVADTAKNKPHVKLIGICFGHQIIARAMGGECVPNNGHWEVGVTDISLTDIGKVVFGTDKPIISMQQMHRDHVPVVPPSFHLLGSTAVSPVQGLIRPYSATAIPLSSPNNIHILTVQGHPEFTTDIVDAIIDIREKSKAMSPEVIADGRERASRTHDGTGAIGKAIWRVLGVEA